MTAGESAREVARKRREKARRLLRVADAYDRGAEGEAATAFALDQLPHGWTVLHDVRWPGRPRANIDHVVVGPGGVYVVDSKNWTGPVTVSDGVLRQDGRAREQAVAGVAEAAQAVTRVIGGVPVVPVLCVVRHEPVAGWVLRDVMVCSTSNIVEMLTSRPPTLAPPTISRLLPVLVRALAPAGGPAASPVDEPRRRQPHDRPARRHRPSRGRARRGPRVPAGRIAALVAAVFVIATLGPQLPGLLDHAVKQGVQRTLAPSAKVGATQTAPAASGHPELAFTVGSVVDTQAVGRKAVVPHGHRLVAVPLTVANHGEAAWTWDGTTRLVLLDRAGVPHAPTTRYPRVAAGSVLPTSPRVAPGQEVGGVAVFDLPVSTQVSQVLVVVGPGLAKTLRWGLGG